MDKKEYLETVMQQIRYKKAKPIIFDELENHIDDQKEAFVFNGMDEKEAYEKAVIEMGDPVDVGVAMDRIHRPKMEWKMIILVLVLSIISIILQFVMRTDMGKEVNSYDVNRQVVFIIVGFVVMISFCFFDYTRIGLFAKLGALTLIILLFLSMTVDTMVNGRSGYIHLCSEYVSMNLLTYLYIPFYGGILYAYKNQGNRGFLKSLLWMIIPVVLSLRMRQYTLSSSLFMIMLIQICFVISKGWFEQSRKRILLIGSLLVGCPVFMILYQLLFGADYQRERILAIFIPNNEYNYVMNIARNLLLGSNIVGKSADDVRGMLPETTTTYILTYVFSYYGILAAVILLLVFGCFVFKVFKISLHQKNQLGLVVGIGCSLVFAVQIVMYVLVNFTVMPTISVFLPMFSCGGTGTIVFYALMGILLSIYRYQNVIPNDPIIKKGFWITKRLEKNQ